VDVFDKSAGDSDWGIRQVREAVRALPSDSAAQLYAGLAVAQRDAFSQKFARKGRGGAQATWDRVTPLKREAAARINNAQRLEGNAKHPRPLVRAKLMPTHPFGCKRPLLSNDYFAAFNRPNLELVTEGIEQITPDSVVTADGARRRIDTLIFATGFETTKYLSAIDVTGRGGLRLADAWRKDGAAAYLGITTAGFPNLFMLYGPNTNNGSLLTMIEYQVEHSLQLLRRILDEDLAWIDVRKQAMQRYNEDVDAAMLQVKAWQAGCNGYYRSPSGRIVTQWPGSMSEYRERTAKPDERAFEVARR